MFKMFSVLIILMSTLIFISCSSYTKVKNHSGLFLIRQNGKYGYINKTGQIIIQPQFDDAKDFSDDLAWVVIGEGRDRKIDYVDKTGKMLSIPNFDMSWEFSEGLARITIGDLDGFIDTTGKIVINPQFVTADDFHDGLAKVRVGGNRRSTEGRKYGYIDKTGKFVIQPKYDFGSDFSEGYALVETDEIQGTNVFINKSGKWKGGGASICSNSKGFSEGYAPCQYGEWGYTDTDRSNLFAYYDDAFKFSEGLARVLTNGKYGYISRSSLDNYSNVRKGEEFAIKPQFEDAGDFSEGLAFVLIDGKWGYIDTSGKIVINPQFNRAFEFSGGLARVGLGQGLDKDIKYGYIDKEGKYVFVPTN